MRQGNTGKGLKKINSSFSSLCNRLEKSSFRSSILNRSREFHISAIPFLTGIKKDKRLD